MIDYEPARGKIICYILASDSALLRSLRKQFDVTGRSNTMAKPQTAARLLAVLLAFVLVAAACGDSDVDTPAAVASTTAVAPTTAVEASLSLAGVCPDPFVIQSSWFPQAEHGAVYELLGDDYVVDVDQKTVRGSMVLGGDDLGIDVEIRAGGPAIGGLPVMTLMATEDDIAIGFVSTDQAMLGFESVPVVAVVAPLELSPQIVMWDPERLPDVETIADLRDLGTTIQSFGALAWQDILAGQGVINLDQIDPSYTGSPANFIAAGDIASQGFASAEPYSYEFDIAEYGRPVKYQLMSEVGYTVYHTALAIRADKKDALDACMKLWVPTLQQAGVNFYTSPERTSAIIVDVVAQQDTFWKYSPELAAFSVKTQVDLGLVGNGPDGIFANQDIARIQTFMDNGRAADLDFPDDLTPEDIITNEYIDESISLP
jgi:hypothetical protein